jgi:hypothetical protein
MGIGVNDKNYDLINQSVGAETMLGTLGPIMERQLEALLNQFQWCEPKLEVLLDYRAKILTIFRMKQRLKQAAAKGAEQTEVFKQMIADAMLKEEGE